MLLSGALKDWSIGFNGLSLASSVYLGASSLYDLDRATHVLKAYTTSPKLGGLFGLGFTGLRPLPLVPKMVKVASNEDSLHFIDEFFTPMLFDGACVAVGGQASPTTVTFDLTYESPVRIDSMAPRPNPNCDALSSLSFSYVVNGLTIQGATYAAGDKTNMFSTKIDMDTTNVRVTITASGQGTITTVRDLLPVTQNLNQGQVPSFGMLLNPEKCTAFALQGMYTNADGLFPGVDVFAKDVA